MQLTENIHITTRRQQVKENPKKTAQLHESVIM